MSKAVSMASLSWIEGRNQCVAVKHSPFIVWKGSRLEMSSENATNRDSAAAKSADEH